MTDAAPTAVEVNEAVFCQTHLKEVCEDCDFDGRETNDSVFGFDTIDREPIEFPTVSESPNKDNVYQCEKHGSTICGVCYNWKKQITRAAKKAAAGRK